MGRFVDLQDDQRPRRHLLRGLQGGLYAGLGFRLQGLHHLPPERGDRAASELSAAEPAYAAIAPELADRRSSGCKWAFERAGLRTTEGTLPIRSASTARYLSIWSRDKRERARDSSAEVCSRRLAFSPGWLLFGDGDPPPHLAENTPGEPPEAAGAEPPAPAGHRRCRLHDRAPGPAGRARGRDLQAEMARQRACDLHHDQRHRGRTASAARSRSSSTPRTWSISPGRSR